MGERIGLSNQREGSRGLPTAAHWPGSRARERARYRIIAGARRYDTSGGRPIYRAACTSHYYYLYAYLPPRARAHLRDQSRATIRRSIAPLAETKRRVKTRGYLLNAKRATPRPPASMKSGTFRSVIGNHGDHVSAVIPRELVPTRRFTGTPCGDRRDRIG